MTDAELVARSSRGDAAAFQILYERHAAFDPERAQLRTWMLSVTRNLCLRHKQRNRRAEQLEVEPFARTATIEQALMRNEVEGAVRNAVDALPQAQREAVFLFEFEGLSLKEVSSVLNIDTNAVKARLHRGREQLKRLLAELKPELKRVGGSES